MYSMENIKDDLSDLGCNGHESLDDLLDLAIELKDRGRSKDSARVHRVRLSKDDYLGVTESVRLLGEVREDTCRDGHHVRSIFDVNYVHYVKDDFSYRRFQPFQESLILGSAVRDIFDAHEYNQSNARDYLLSVNDPILLNENICKNKRSIISEQFQVCEGRIFSGNSFFSHRHDFLRNTSIQDVNSSNVDCIGRLVLFKLFLFGLSLARKDIVDALGSNAYEVLVKSCLLRVCSFRNSHVVAEVQIYPISLSDLYYIGDDTSCLLQGDREKLLQSLFIITDWPMESLRSSTTAIMPIGYDSLELCAISSYGSDNRSCKKVLDLCCGSGIQGLFYWVNNLFCEELFLVDINERACQYAIANISLNSTLLKRGVDNLQRPLNNIHVLNGSLFNPLYRDLSFDRILSNPPFVSLPCETDIEFALYAASGEDGLDVVRTMFGSCFDYLESNGKFLVVTELPNVEDSCELVLSFISESERSTAKISIVYVENDVETIQEYVKERSYERGVSSMEFNSSFSGWEIKNIQRGIRNRALVLLSISRCVDGPKLDINPFEGDLCDNEMMVSHPSFDNAHDEEDIFLTKSGIFFARSLLLS